MAPMKKAGICAVLGAAAASFCGLHAWAGPPAGESNGFVNRLTAPLESARLARSFGRGSLGQTRSQPMGQLDLRPPAMTFGQDRAALRYRPLGGQPSDSENQSRFSNLGAGTDALPMKSTGRLQEFAQRIHREGLPVARLWESHSALLSLGLNQRGKPGLWLVQKTH